MLASLYKSVLACIVIAGLSACQSIDVMAPKESVRFIDLRQFDDELSFSLRSVSSPIEVDFISLPTPNDIPARLERWISAVGASGGKVEVVLPEDELVSRNPLALIGLAASIAKSAESLIARQRDSNRESLLRNRDVKVYLTRDPQGSLRIAKVVFDIRSTAR